MVPLGTHQFPIASEPALVLGSLKGGPDAGDLHEMTSTAPFCRSHGTKVRFLPVGDFTNLPLR